jgi:hypothetical protein
MTKSEQRQNQIVTVTQGISLFCVFIGLFVGTLYAFDGNLFIAIPVSLVMLIGMYFFVIQLVAAKMERKRSGFTLGVKMSILLFLIISLPVSYYIVHAVNVEFYEKAKIQEIGLQKIECLRGLKKEYTADYSAYLSNRRQKMIDYLTQYDNKLISASKVTAALEVNEAFVQTHIKWHGDITADNYIIAEKLRFLRADTAIFGNTAKYLEAQTDIVTSWNRFAINNSLRDLDENLIKTHGELNAFLTENAKGNKLDPMDASCSSETNINQPLVLLKEHRSAKHLLLLFLIYFLLLLPYVIAPGRYYAKKSKRNSDEDGPHKGPTIR